MIKITSASHAVLMIEQVRAACRQYLETNGWTVDDQDRYSKRIYVSYSFINAIYQQKEEEGGKV